MIMDKESEIIYVVNRIRISASEYNQNGNTRTFLYKDKANAEQCLNNLRSEALSELERLKRDYEIYTDSDEKFHLAWDSDLEMIFITLKKHFVA